jgi:hypothetical protein
MNFGEMKKNEVVPRLGLEPSYRGAKTGALYEEG